MSRRRRRRRAPRRREDRRQRALADAIDWVILAVLFAIFVGLASSWGAATLATIFGRGTELEPPVSQLREV